MQHNMALSLELGVQFTHKESVMDVLLETVSQRKTAETCDHETDAPCVYD